MVFESREERAWRERARMRTHKVWLRQLAADPRMAKLERDWAGTGALSGEVQVDAKTFIIELWDWVLAVYPGENLSRFHLNDLTTAYEWFTPAEDDAGDDDIDYHAVVMAALADAGFLKANRMLVNWPGDNWGGQGRRPLSPQEE
jgi:hypothetical protein